MLSFTACKKQTLLTEEFKEAENPAMIASYAAGGGGGQTSCAEDQEQLYNADH